MVGLAKVESIRRVVLLPAPLGPSRPNISPFLTSNEISSRATKSSNFFVRLSTLIMRVTLANAVG